MIAWLRTLWAAARDEAALIARERSILLVLVAVPLLYPAIVGWLYRAEDVRERPALLLDLDGSALSRRLALRLDATPGVAITGRPATLDEGVAALRDGQAELLLVVPADLSRRVRRGEPARLAVWAGGANLYTWGIAYPDVVAVVGALDAELAARAFMAHGLPPAAAAARAAPIATGDRNLFHPTGGYGRYFALGIMLIVVQQAVVVSMAFSAGVRRELGLDRAGRWPVAVGLGRALAHAPFWLGGVAFILGAVVPLMGWSGPSAAAMAVPFLGLVAVLVPVALSIATVVRDRLAAFQLLMFFSAPLFVASGFTWPASQLPASVRLVTAVFPATPALRALRVLSMKSSSLADVGPELLWLAVQLAAALLVAAVVVHRSWRRLPGFPWGLGPARPAPTPVTPSPEVQP